MRFEDVYVAGTGAAFPEPILVTDAVTAGWCPPCIAKETDAVSVVASAADTVPAALAAAAAREALARARCQAAGIDLILHATVYYQGQDLWAAASYVQRLAAGNRCPAIEVRQLSNGGMAALELAAGYLTAGTGRSAALITAADAFRAPGFDRWQSDPGTLYADGGVALVLSRHGGFARLRSIASVSDPELEGMHRGDDPFSPAPFSIRQPIDLDAWKRAFTTRAGRSFAPPRVAAGQREAVSQALAEADADLAAIDWFILPHFGRRRLEAGPLRHFKIGMERTTWEWSRHIGHLGAGDQIASLDHLATAGKLRPGQRCLLFGVGAGFTWSCAVLEVTSEPPEALSKAN